VSRRMGLCAALAAAVIGVTFVGAQPQNRGQQKIATKVLSDLRGNGSVTFFVVMTETADTSAANGIDDWAARGQVVVDTLKAVANRTQGPVLQLLSRSPGVNVTPFWIVNAIRVRVDAASVFSGQLINQLAGRADVDAIREDVQWEIPVPLAGIAEPGIQGVEWGVARVHAPDVWDQFRTRGEGIVVASIDTGVQFDHPALVGHYRGLKPDGSFDHNYNWYDPSQFCSSPSPCDDAGHGTHTMGTMVGDDGGSNQIGVAPGATWITAKACEYGCASSDVLAAGQWMLAPTDLNGANPRPDLRPQIVSNSWGNASGDLFYRATVQAWRASGIFPAFANGNAGALGCGSVVVPAAYPESFGVGAVDINDNIADFSSRGPSTLFGALAKPDVSAPGANVRSSVPNDSYDIYSGTSMATPHVAGVVALMWSALPALVGNVSATINLLDASADQRDSTECGAVGPPNNVYGWGIVNALAAVQAGSGIPVRTASTKTPGLSAPPLAR
jgi:subtilisin family serine protease